jgi:ATP adenylyltransferase
MNHVWSPWRIQYIEDHDRMTDCVFCVEAKRQDGPGNLIVYRGQLSFVILNRYPYTSGHLMIVPFAHSPSLEALSAPTRSELMELVSHSTSVLRAIYQPDGFNIGANIGSAAGAGIADHVHLHVVPRWTGDTNFMSTLGNTRVLPETLEDTYRRVHNAWRA